MIAIRVSFTAKHIAKYATLIAAWIIVWNLVDIVLLPVRAIERSDHVAPSDIVAKLR